MTEADPAATPSDGLRALLSEAAERDAAARATYELLKSRGALNGSRLLTIRCPRRCTMLEVFETTIGRVFRQPPYVLSDDLNAATSTPAGRVGNTVDGYRRWKEQVGPLATGVDLVLVCRHVHLLVPWQKIGAALDANDRELTVHH